jgi:hypothetical protein
MSMDSARQRLNVRTIRVSARAALRSAPHGDAAAISERARALVAAARADTTDGVALRDLAELRRELDELGLANERDAPSG